MVNSLVASLALFGASASASLLSAGTAHVINACSYVVYLCNVPASGGGHEQSDLTLAAGESWSQPWTELSNGNGWSIKLSKSKALENILQYEYTFHNDGIIWYDLSCVNGNPWDKNWEITASDGCNPKQQAYRYATDDAYGMQSCAQDASITVTLCSGEAADNSTSSSSSASAPAYSSTSAAPPAYTSTTEEATPTPTPSSSSPIASSLSESLSASPSASSSAAKTSADDSAPTWWKWHGGQKANVEEATPTTFATSTTAAQAVVTERPNGVVVTEIETAIVTQLVTAYADGNSRVKRHAHQHLGHAHQHHA